MIMSLQLRMKKAKFVVDQTFINHHLNIIDYLNVFQKKTTETKRIPKNKAQGLILEGKEL